jgi:cobalt-zinc-cadmium resistance protein CzcA
MVEKHENELKYEIRKAFYTYSVLSEKLKLIIEIESIYQKFKLITDVRFNAGEINALEGFTAENKLQLIEIQKTELKAEMNQLIEQIQLLTGSSEPVIPKASEFKVNKTEWSQNLVQQNPLIRLSANQVENSKQKIKFERSKLLPNLFVGYNNISFLGIGADDILYTSRKTRFQSFQLGLSIPIFYKSQHTRVSVEKIAFKQAESLYEWVIQLQNTKWKQIQNKENAADEVVKKLESKALLISEQLLEKATTQLHQGEINFIQWAFLADQSIQIKISYLDSIQKLNDARIELLFITQQ